MTDFPANPREGQVHCRAYDGLMFVFRGGRWVPRAVLVAGLRGE